MRKLTKAQMKERLTAYIDKQKVTHNSGIDQSKVERIIEEALQCDNPYKYVSACLWRMEIDAHRKQLAKVRTELQLAKVREKFSKEQELAARTKEVLEEIEHFMKTDHRHSRYWEALSLSITHRKGWSHILCEKYGMNANAVYQWKRRAFKQLKKRRPDLVTDDVISHVKANREEEESAEGASC